MSKSSFLPFEEALVAHLRGLATRQCSVSVFSPRGGSKRGGEGDAESTTEETAAIGGHRTLSENVGNQRRGVLKVGYFTRHNVETSCGTTISCRDVWRGCRMDGVREQIDSVMPSVPSSAAGG